jgi:hypothetical protein
MVAMVNKVPVVMFAAAFTKVPVFTGCYLYAQAPQAFHSADIATKNPGRQDTNDVEEDINNGGW